MCDCLASILEQIIKSISWKLSTQIFYLLLAHSYSVNKTKCLESRRIDWEITSQYNMTSVI